jgi:hypothetical protein
MWLRPGDRNGVKVLPYSEDTMPTLGEGTSVISLGLAYRRKTTDYNQLNESPDNCTEILLSIYKYIKE